MRVVLITGGFDPLHSGHIAYIQAAKSLGDYLIVGVNSDEWLIRKKGQPFMPFSERATLVGAIAGVDEVIQFDDSDNTAIDAIRTTRLRFGPDHKIVFGNGGDRTKDNTPEQGFCNAYNIDMLYHLGGGKVQSSSKLISQENES